MDIYSLSSNEYGTDYHPTVHLLLFILFYILIMENCAKIIHSLYRVPLKSTTGIYIGDRHRIVACSYGLHFGFISSIFYS